MKVPISKEQVSIPWLNEVLSARGIKVVSFAWDGPADNGVLAALSSLERVILTIRREGSAADKLESFPIVVKTLPEDPGVRSYVIKHDFCLRELKVYTELFPQWKSFLDERSVPPEHRCRLPDCYYGAEEGTCDDWRHILFIEDLVAAGLKMWPGGFAASLSWREAKSIVKQIALFHAVGIAYRMCQGIHYSSKSYLMTRSDENLDYYIQSGFDATVKMLQEEREKQSTSGNDVDKEFLIDGNVFEVLNGFRSTIPELVVRMTQFDSTTASKLETLCHMDLHVNNIMFSDGFQDAVFLDFQAARPAPPMKDLSMFLILNCENSLLSSERPKVLEYYHNTLQAATKAMGVDLSEYTLEKLTQEYTDYAYLSLLHIMTGAPQWCFGKGTSEVTRKRFRDAILLMYKQGLLHKDK